MSGVIERFEIRRRSSSGVLQEINGNIESGINYVAVITLPPTSSSSIFIEAIKLYEGTPGPNNFVFDLFPCVLETDIKPDECALRRPSSTNATIDTVELLEIPIGVLKPNSSYSVDLTFGTSPTTKLGDLLQVEAMDINGRPSSFTVTRSAPQSTTDISIANVPAPAPMTTAEDGRAKGLFTTLSTSISSTQTTLSTSSSPTQTTLSTSASPTQTTLSNNPGLAPAPAPAPAPAATSTIPAISSSSGLSTGAQAGIGVGVAVAVIAAALLLAFVLLRRRKRARRAAAYDVSLSRSERDFHAEKELGVVAAAPAVARGASSRAADDGGGLDGGVAGGLGSEGRSRNGELVRKPVGEGAVAGTVPVATTLLSEEERARWEEEERRLDEDIAEAERRRRAG